MTMGLATVVRLSVVAALFNVWVKPAEDLTKLASPE
jgi:hypothetical protein